MLALWVCGNGWRCAACAEEEQPPADAMVAALALDQVEDLRVTHWRAQHGLTLDSDFAFHFIEFDQAVSAAGRAVAQAWLEARHAAMGHMLHDVDQAMEEVERAAPSATRSLRVKPTARKRPLRLRENTVSSPAAVQRRVEALCQVWINAGALRPTGMVSREILASWEKSCLRLAQKHVAHAEPVTVNNAVATFRELQSSLQHRGRGFPPQAVDIDFSPRVHRRASQVFQQSEMADQAGILGLAVISCQCAQFRAWEEEERPRCCGYAINVGKVGGGHPTEV